jgi:hypothetical protein
MRWAFLLVLAACKPSTIAGEDAAPMVDSATVADATIVDATTPDVIDANVIDADDPDACVPGDTWDAKVELTYGSDKFLPKLIVPKTLDVVLLRTKQRKVVYGMCDQTGGGCGDCSKAHSDMPCTLTPTHVNVVIGTDDFSTSVNILQRNNAIVADWTTGPIEPGTGPNTLSKRSEVLIKLPCAVKIRFVR